MAASTYVVRLIDCQKKAGGVEGNADKVLANLKVWYTSVCQTASSGGAAWTADVQWLDAPPSSVPGQAAEHPLTVNMLLFFVPSPRSSVITLHPQWSKITLPALSDTDILGQTVTSGVVSGGRRGAATIGISEIYISRCREADSTRTIMNLSRIAFHESMHNQLNLSNDMHRGGTGFRADPPIGNSPDGANLKAMAAAIPTLVPQWIDGFQAWKSNSEDPLGRP